MKLIVEIDIPNHTPAELDTNRADWFPTDDPNLVGIDSAYLKPDPSGEDFYLFRLVSVVTTSPVGTSAETLTIYPPDDDSEQWHVIGDLREVVDCDDESTNYLVFRHLVADGWPQANLDPEYSCFYGYADTEAEANKLADDAMRWALKVCNEKGGQ